MYPDCRPQFVALISETIAVGNEGFSPPRVEAPFVDWTKAEIAAHGTRLAAPFALTWSCYQGGSTHCGVCGTCYERREAFREIGVVDQVEYLDSTTRFVDPTTDDPARTRVGR